MTTRLGQHELLDLQEHIRVEAATAHQMRRISEQVKDPDLRRLVEMEEQAARRNVQKLMSHLQGPGAEH